MVNIKREHGPTYVYVQCEYIRFLGAQQIQQLLCLALLEYSLIQTPKRTMPNQHLDNGRASQYNHGLYLVAFTYE